MLMIILVLFVYYLTVQAFTYDRRFVIIVLKVVFILMKTMK